LGKISRAQTTSARFWPKATTLSYFPTSRVPCGINRFSPVTVSQTFSVTDAMVAPGKSEFKPVIRLAGMIDPAMTA
jgi:hypothetical protein